ncbi:hypothetical protein BGU59_19415, partial [Clostridioides difficile]
MAVLHLLIMAEIMVVALLLLLMVVELQQLNIKIVMYTAQTLPTTRPVFTPEDDTAYNDKKTRETDPTAAEATERLARKTASIHPTTKLTSLA